MHPSQLSASRLALGLMAGAAAWCLFAKPLVAEDAAAPKRAETPAQQSKPSPKKAEPKLRKKLTGAELYALHCNRCHPERYAAERTPEQWKTILLHMRTRATLPGEQARAILQYLQEDSGK